MTQSVPASPLVYSSFLIISFYPPMKLIEREGAMNCGSLM